ncbi:MAG: hypothetical protein PF961_13915 [Planctomycetota bacterium]|jgi:hypothetical protein|nr:hypothetical protein [Planctomycetota bacterium]
MAAQMALRILAGESVSDIPLGTSPVRAMFDYQQLQQFGIEEKILPAGSLVINRPFSFYATYREMIWAVLAALLL